MPRTPEGRLYCEVCERIAPSLAHVEYHWPERSDVTCRMEVCDECLQQAPTYGVVLHTADEGASSYTIQQESGN